MALARWSCLPIRIMLSNLSAARSARQAFAFRSCFRYPNFSISGGAGERDMAKVLRASGCSKWERSSPARRPAMLLADLGAEVIKIEHPEAGDPFRAFKGGLYSPAFPDLQPQQEEHHAQHQAARRTSRRSTALVEDADVFIQNFRPGVAERLGVDPERLQAINPRLVYCAISGFGATGPDKDRPAFDTVAQAASGFLRLLVNPEQPARRRPGDRRRGHRLLRRLRRARRAVRAARDRQGAAGRGLDARGDVPLQPRRLHPLFLAKARSWGRTAGPTSRNPMCSNARTAAGSRCTCPRRPNSGRRWPRRSGGPDMLQLPEFADRNGADRQLRGGGRLPRADLPDAEPRGVARNAARRMKCRPRRSTLRTRCFAPPRSGISRWRSPPSIRKWEPSERSEALSPSTGNAPLP